MRSVVAHIVSCILLAGISLMTSCREDEVIILAEYERLPLGDNSRSDYAGLYLLNEGNMGSNKCTLDFVDVVRQIADEELGDCDRIHIIEPLDVMDFHNFMKKSYLILTDSGGVQEEAPSLGKPVLVMRDTTERPEGVEAGTLRLVGTNEENIYNNFKTLITDDKEYTKMAQAKNPYGDGFASVRIADILEEFF